MKRLCVLFLQTLILSCALLAATQLASAATDTWSSTPVGVNWNSTDWTGGNAPPLAGDSLVFATSTQTTLNNDLVAGTAFSGLTFNGGSAFTLNGFGILLSGSVSNNIGIANLSGQAQTIGTMPLKLDWGYYTFSSPSGTLALDSTLTPNLGGVAVFDGASTLTSSSLTTDASGLITSLGGAGFYGQTGVGGGFNSLATLSGTTISGYTYSGGQIISAAGALPSNPAGVNIELTATVAGNYTLPNVGANNFINTILVANNTANKIVLASANSGTLVLGNLNGIGGIYLLSAAGIGQGLTIGGGTSCFLTAGNMTGSPTPGTIVFGINGTTSANQAQESATIQNNGSGGAVTVVKTGSGSMYFASANTYSGGTYVLQGQLQANAAGSLGTGPLYVAPGATTWLNGTGTYVNDLYVTPGNGTVVETGTALHPGALLMSYATCNGKLTLLGAPVPSATYPPTAGCRLSGDKDAGSPCNLNGQITGTGTLDLNSSPHAILLVLNNATANANDWQGGLIIEESLSNPSSARTMLVTLGGAQTYTQIPHGAGKGDVTLYAGATSGSFIASSTVTLNLNSLNTTINGLNGASAAGVANVIVANNGSTACTLTVGDNNASGNYGGVTTDTTGHALGLTKIGNGTQTFTGALGHHGSTTVNAGSFALSGSATLANTPVITVAAPGTFDVTGLGNFTVAATPTAQTLNCVGTVLGNLNISGTVQALDAIGTLTETGAMTFNPGGTYVWDINDASAITGTAGGDPGWSLLNVSGTLDLSALTASSFTINVTSLTSGDVAGNAVHFNPSTSYSWRIAHAAGGITGFNNSTPQFNIVTSAFANHPNSSAQWSVSLDGTGNYLLLNFNGFPVITTPLPPTPLVVNQNGTAVFTVTANSLGTGPAFAWTQNGNPLSNGGTSAGGGNVTIATSNGGYTSTLTITGVDQVQADVSLDSSTISVTATETYSSTLQTGVSTETLTVIDIPYNPNVTPSAIAVPVSAGAADILCASASGTSPFTYQWYLNGNLINGATAACYQVNVSPATAGSYTVVISNPAGGVTSSATVITPVSVVPNQVLFEPFNYPQQSHPATPPGFWTAVGVTNLFNQATGVGVAWQNIGNNDFTTLPANLVDPYTVAPYGVGIRPIVGNEYPVAGLAGNEVSMIYADSDINGGQVNLPFGAGGAITTGTVYFSTVIQFYGVNPNSGTAYTDYVCGLGTGAASSTTHSVGLYILQPTPVNTFPNAAYTLGVFKGNLTTGALAPGSNGDWVPANPSYPPGVDSAFLDYNVHFVVGRLNINAAGAGHSTVDLWVDPPSSSFYANEANVPTPNVANAAGTVADDWSGGVSLFYMKITTYPVDRYFADLRVGKTWASVTPPSAPTLAVANQILTNPVSSTVVFASQNAGNPVDPSIGAYQWQFNGGSPLTDGPSGHGPSGYSGSGTSILTITNATSADLGTYTVSGSNKSPAPSDNSATLTGSASALLTAKLPSLFIASSPPNIIVSWPTNWPAMLQATASLSPPITWTSVVGGESSFLYWPPGSGALAWAPVSPISISGTNYTVTVAAASSSDMFFRLAPSP